jgi:hypothetical protein
MTLMRLQNDYLKSIHNRDTITIGLYQLVTYIITTLILMVFLVYMLIAPTNMAEQAIFIRTLALFGWVLFIWSILSWYKLRKEIIDLYMIFLVVMFLFNFSQPMLLLFGLLPEGKGILGTKVESSVYISAQFFSLISLAMFHIGALVAEKGNKTKISDIGLVDKNKFVALKIVGWIMLLTSFPSFTVDLIETMNTVKIYGYAALYNYSVTTNQIEVAEAFTFERFFQYFSSYFIPSLICLLVAYHNRRAFNLLFRIIMVLFVLNSLFIGRRGDAVCLLLMILCLSHYIIRPFTKKQLLLYGVAGYYFLGILGIIAKMRNMTGRSFIDYIEGFFAAFGTENLVLDTIAEMGGSLFPLASVINIMPEQFSFAYQYGTTYLWAFTAIIPNVNLWSVHPAMVYAECPNWLKVALNMSYGPGFSIIAEGFRNFGWLGFFTLYYFGKLIGGICSSVTRNTIIQDPFKLCLTVVFINEILMIARGDFIMMIRPFFYIVLPMWFILKIIYSELKKQQRFE